MSNAIPTAIVIDATVRGLAAGDSMSWMAAGQRIHLLPERRARMLHEMASFSEERGSTTRPVPHAHNSPTVALRPGPADDVEWFVVTAEVLSGRDQGVTLHERWMDLAHVTDGLRARSGTHYALANLRRGLLPPQSGNDNAHYFDDIACVRAIAAGLLARDEREATVLATADAEVTHALDGVWCAVAVAVLVQSVTSGAELATAVDNAVEHLPATSWSRRMVETALALAAHAVSPLDVAHQLREHLTDRIYTYSIAAPETLAILLAHARTARSADELLLGALAHPRNADALPALAGAVAGAAFGMDWVPQALREGPIMLDGVCVPSLAGHRLDDTIDRISAARTAEA